MQYMLLRHGRFPGEYLRLPPGEQVMVNALILDGIRLREEG